MKSLKQYITEQMVCELSSPTLKNAHDKQVELNGGKESNRSRKFAKGARDAHNKELLEKMPLKKLVNIYIEEVEKKNEQTALSKEVLPYIFKALINNNQGGTFEQDGYGFFVKTDNAFSTFIEYCEDYIENQIGEYGLNDEGTDFEDSEYDNDENKWCIDEVQGYKKELNEIHATKDNNKKWELLLNSGIFHDGCGKISDYNNDGGTYFTEY